MPPNPDATKCRLTIDYLNNVELNTQTVKANDGFYDQVTLSGKRIDVVDGKVTTTDSVFPNCETKVLSSLKDYSGPEVVPSAVLSKELGSIVTNTATNLATAVNTLKAADLAESNRAKSAEAKLNTSVNDLSVRITNNSKVVDDYVASNNSALSSLDQKVDANAKTSYDNYSKNVLGLVALSDNLNKTKEVLDKSISDTKTELSDKINANTTEMRETTSANAQNITKNSQSVVNERARAIEAEGALSKRITAEQERALEEEQKITTRVSNLTSVVDEHKTLTAASLVSLAEEAKLLVRTEESNRDAAIAEAIGNLVAGAPKELDTLREITDLLKDDTELGSVLAKQLAELEQKHVEDRTALDAETARAKAKESGIEAALAAEVERATNAENDNKSLVDHERQRAIARESELEGSVNTLNTKFSEADSVLSSNLAVEIDRAKSSEDALRTMIQTEENRAKREESSLSTRLENEVSRAKQEETNLSQRISDTNNAIALKSVEILTHVNTEDAKLGSRISDLNNVVQQNKDSFESQLHVLEGTVSTNHTTLKTFQSETTANFESADLARSDLSTRISTNHSNLTKNLTTLEGKTDNTFAEHLSKINMNTNFIQSNSDYTKSEVVRLESKMSNNKKLSDDGDVKLQLALDREVDNRVVGDEESVKSANAYTDSKFKDLLGNAPAEYDTLKELSDFMQNNADVAVAMNTKISENSTALDGLDDRFVRRSGKQMESGMVTDLFTAEVSRASYLYLGQHWRLRENGDDGVMLLMEYTPVAGSTNDEDFTRSVPLHVVN